MLNNNKEVYGEIWKANTNDYKKYSAGNRWFNARLNKLIIDYLQNQNIQSIADMGCGDGSKTYLLANQFADAKVTGYDFVKEAINAAEHSYQLDNLAFLCDDINFYSNHVDMVTAFEVLEHIDDWKSCVDSWVSLNPCYFLFSFPTGRMRKTEYKFGHVRHFKKMEMETYLQKKGYRALEANYAGFPFYSPLFCDIQYTFVQTYLSVQTNKMSRASKAIHYCIYLLFQYCSTRKKYGDCFMGLFERVENENFIIKEQCCE